MSYEAFSSATIRVPRTFDWNSHDAAKREFEEMYAVLRQCMGERCWVLDEEQTKTFMPSDLPQAPARNADAEVKEAYETKKEKHDEKLNVIYRAFYYYGSMVRRDIDAAIDSPPAGTARADWTSVKAFRAKIERPGSSKEPQVSVETLLMREGHMVVPMCKVPCYQCPQQHRSELARSSVNSWLRHFHGVVEQER